jgi:hypothetical protein
LLGREAGEERPRRRARLQQRVVGVGEQLRVVVALDRERLVVVGGQGPSRSVVACSWLTGASRCPSVLAVVSIMEMCA